MVIMARRLPIFSCSAAKEAVKMIKWQISPSPSLSHSFSLSSSISSWVLPLLWPLLLTNVRIYLGKYYSLQLLQCGAPLMVLAKTALIKNQIDFMEFQQFSVRAITATGAIFLLWFKLYMLSFMFANICFEKNKKTRFMLCLS